MELQMTKDCKKVMLKCAEELSELTTRLLQHCNKDKDYLSHIKAEIKDVERQISLLKKII